MLELLSPAGSMEALRAAVQNGADAVYLGYGEFNARRNAKNFSVEELQEAVSYCHVRGVQVHMTLNILISDREMKPPCWAAMPLSSRTWAWCSCANRSRPTCPSTPPPR